MIEKVGQSRRAPASILELEDLRVWFPVYGGVFPHVIGNIKAVDGVSFTVERGETLGVVGESGCGKSTLGKAVMRLVNATSGHIHYRDGDGKPAVDLAALGRRRMRPYRSRIQMVYQDPYSSLNPRLAVRDIIEEPLLVHRRDLSRVERLEKVGWLLEKVGLRPEHAERYPHEFSGGQRQRIGVARALSTHPQLIIADEPVSALDVSVQAQVINLFMDLQEEFGLTIVFIAHDLSVVEHIARRIAVMYLGEVVEIGDTEALLRRPLHPYTRALLSAVPRPDPDVRRPGRIVLTGDVPSPMQKPSGCAFRTRCPIAQPECALETPRLGDARDGETHRAACRFAPRYEELLAEARTPHAGTA